ncbi:hypothetical protein M3C60_006225 [Micrococcus luteus]|nr:hypothetical protein [Micrococcus luteus]MCV7467123.1 hypothetical protein [Micrococcus luteus]
MQILIHTIRALNYVVREDLFDKPIGSFPAEVCPDEHRDEVYDQLERLEFIPRDDRLVGGLPIQVNGRKRGPITRLARQYRRAEAEWQVLASIRDRPDSAESYDAALTAEIDGERLTDDEVEQAADRLLDRDCITGIRTFGSKLPVRPELTAAGEHLLDNDLTTITSGAQEASVSNIDNSMHVTAGRDATGLAAGTGNTVNAWSAGGDGSRLAQSFAELREGIEQARSELGAHADEILEHVDAAETLVPTSTVAARSMIGVVQDKLAEFAGSAAGQGLITLTTAVLAQLPA